MLRVVGPLCVVCLFTGACAGDRATEPTRTTTSARVSTVDPATGTTLTKGTPFKISFTVEYAQDAFTLYTVAFVRDDGRYSPPLTCGGGGSSGGAFAGQTVDVSGIVGTDWKGNILYQFASGHRVNALLLLKRLPGPPSGPASDCVPIGTGGRDPGKPTEGAVFPENADQRVDMTLNWSIQP
jgi:hypothetical protein